MSLAATASIVFACSLPLPLQEPTPAAARFPASTALAEGVSPDALAALDELVQGFVDAGEVVGAELLVVKNGRAILHAAYGWRDREARVEMAPGGVFCVRSMTKPVVGAAVMMLIEDGLLELDTRVAEHLPAFDVEGSREITVEHLLTHTSGLPMSLLLGRDLRALEGVRAVAELGGGHALDFEPGAAFQYSDQGVDTLTALIELVTGAPAADFVRARVLAPLEMADSACVLDQDHPLRERACVKYAGSPGDWTRFWGPDEPPLFPFFLGSQGLYSTLEDYARFLDLWLDKGRVGRERLLRWSAVRRALRPGPHPFDAPSGFPGLASNYGSLMQLWTRAAEDGGERELVAFGHGGSDGTYAWAFPEEDALALYFTQSRGTPTGLRVEERLAELFLGEPFDPLQAAPPLEPYLGYYWEGEGDLYRAIVRDGEDLALEIVGKAIVPLDYVGEDRWKLRPQPGTVIAFDRAESGEVSGFHIGEHQELRLEPSSELPSADELAARVAATHGLDRLESLGPLRIRSAVSIEKLELSGESTAWLAAPDRWRVDEATGGETSRVAFDGAAVREALAGAPVSELTGPRGEALRLDSPLTHFGDWRRWYPRMEVIQRLTGGDDEVFLVRMGDASAPAATFYVDGASGRLLRIDDVAWLPRLGRVGRKLRFDDFRDHSGVLLPHRTRIELAHALIGEVVSTVEELELGVELPAGLFALRD